MRETPEDLGELQSLLERSIEQAGPFLRSSFEMPEHSLNAQQLANHLQGLPTVAMATVTARGEPRVAPISAIFYRGRFHIPTVRSDRASAVACSMTARSSSLKSGRTSSQASSKSRSADRAEFSVESPSSPNADHCAVVHCSPNTSQTRRQS